MTVNASASLDELQDLFNDHAFLGFPVVDDGGVLVGVVSRTDVDAAILERSESDNMRLQGIVGDELRSMPLASAVSTGIIDCIALRVLRRS